MNGTVKVLCYKSKTLRNGERPLMPIAVRIDIIQSTPRNIGFSIAQSSTPTNRFSALLSKESDRLLSLSLLPPVLCGMSWRRSEARIFDMSVVQCHKAIFF